MFENNDVDETSEKNSKSLDNGGDSDEYSMIENEEDEVEDKVDDIKSAKSPPQFKSKTEESPNRNPQKGGKYISK